MGALVKSYIFPITVIDTINLEGIKYFYWIQIIFKHLFDLMIGHLLGLPLHVRADQEVLMVKE